MASNGFPLSTPRRKGPPEPRLLTYPREQVIGRQMLIFGLPAAVFFMFCCLLLPSANNPCNAVFILALLGGVGYGCFFLHVFLRRFAVHPPCPYCGKTLSSDLSWVCGFCDQVHNSPFFFSVFLRCKRCGNAPKAYKCHHPICGHIVYLDRDFDASHCAYAVGQAPPKVRRVDEEDFEEQWQLEARTREHAIKLVSLEAEYYDEMTRLREARTKLDKAKHPPKPQDPVQIEIQRMLQKLKTRAAKEDALEQWHAERRDEIKAKKLRETAEEEKLSDLADQVKYARGHMT
jgi:hypothetical protein